MRIYIQHRLDLEFGLSKQILEFVCIKSNLCCALYNLYTKMSIIQIIKINFVATIPFILFSGYQLISKAAGRPSPIHHRREVHNGPVLEAGPTHLG